MRIVLASLAPTPVSRLVSQSVTLSDFHGFGVSGLPSAGTLLLKCIRRILWLISDYLCSVAIVLINPCPCIRGEGCCKFGREDIGTSQAGALERSRAPSLSSRTPVPPLCHVGPVLPSSPPPPPSSPPFGPRSV